MSGEFILSALDGQHLEWIIRKSEKGKQTKDNGSKYNILPNRIMITRSSMNWDVLTGDVCDNNHWMLVVIYAIQHTT